MKSKHNLIIRFATVAAQSPVSGSSEFGTPFTRHVGFVPATYIMSLLDHVDLAANPRSSRRNGVVEDILNTLDASPELFHFKSKGILVGSSNYEKLQRNRFRLRFDDPSVEGVLDGGHNLLAIGLHMLWFVMEDRDWKRIKSWDNMKQAWSEYRKDLEVEKDSFDFLVPVELLVPSDDEADRDTFLMPLLEVCEARNNNAQLPIEAKSNKQGFYDAIKDVLPDGLARRVEWKPNSWEDASERRPIKVRDLIALAWIPLNVLGEQGRLPGRLSLPPQNTYQNKGECSKRFEELMSSDEVTAQDQGARRTLTHKGVRSAFNILADLPELYDQIYKEFPSAYNNGGKRRFATNTIVKIYSPDRRKAALVNGKDAKTYLASQPTTPFYREPVDYSYPDGLISPLIYGLKGLMAVKKGKVVWAVDNPADFVAEHLVKLADSYQLVMNMARWDPQKISKDPGSYEFAVREFNNLLVRQFGSN